MGDDGKKKKLAIMGVSSVLLVAMVAAVAVGVNNREGNDGSNNNGGHNGGISTSQRNVQALCHPTDYKETCVSTLSSANTSDPKELVKAGFKATVHQLEGAISNCSIIREAAKDPRTTKAVDVCKKLMGHAIDDLEDSFDKMGSLDLTDMSHFLDDLKVWLTGAVAHQEACLDAFTNTTGDAGEKMTQLLNVSRELTSNALTMVTEFSSVITSLSFGSSDNNNNNGVRKLLSLDNDGFPTWLSAEKRKLLADAADQIKADVVVAQDGSGQAKTVNEALKLIPKNNAKTFVIHVKAGIYKEALNFDKTMTNVLLMGDGPLATKITFGNSYADGTPILETATLAAVGKGFILRDIGIENSAGPEKHQAVALRVQSDKSVIYNCNIDGFQNTVYTHAHRQFYRDCTISGTIDIISGDAPALFQNSKLVVKKPMDEQKCTVTAQARAESHEHSAIILQNCTITADPAYLPFKDANPAYLGRPWKQFSRTIIMNSQIDGFIQPVGWVPWAGNLFLDTCYFAEVNNRGPGAATTGRPKWKGIQHITPEEAAQFTAGVYLLGDDWIPQTGVPYTSGMINA